MYKSSPGSFGYIPKKLNEYSEEIDRNIHIFINTLFTVPETQT